MAKVTGGRGKKGAAKGRGERSSTASTTLASRALLRGGSRPARDQAGTAERGHARGAPGARKRKEPTNLSLDPVIATSAINVAKAQGSNLSALVNDLLETYVRAATAPRGPARTPAVRRLVGAAAGGTADREAYRAHLLAKYGTQTR